MFKIFNQYKGLRKELYVLFFGRTVTSLGAMINPLLTLILSSKLHFDAASIALLLLFFSLVGLPATYFAGYLADRYNKRNLIIVFDLITVVCYVACGFVPLGTTSIRLIFVGSLFATMEHPIYDALVADLSSTENREVAFSLNYLGMNLGFVLAPTLGGLLFENYLHIAFIISGLATLSSTILIYLMIKDVSRSQSDHDIYENSDEQGVWEFLSTKKIILFYILCTTIIRVTYGQSHFLLPLNLEKIHGGDTGALVYGTLNSMNAFIVTIGTPIITILATRIKDVSKLMMGQFLIMISYLFFVFNHNIVSLYYIHMMIFTMGEIVETLGSQPYLTRRIPARLRGRISSIVRLVPTICLSFSQYIVGYCIDHYEITYIWIGIVIFAGIGILLLYVLKTRDKKEYPLLYK